MGIFSFLNDNFINIINGLGTSKDPMQYTNYTLSLMSKDAQEAAYRGDWLARRIVDAPAEDATREWRSWQSSNQQTEAIEDTERAFQIQMKTREAISKGRLYGGAALVLGVDDRGKSDEELILEKVGKDALKFVVVLNRWELNAGPRDYNVFSPWFTRPQYYTIATPLYGFDMKAGDEGDDVYPRQNFGQAPPIPDQPRRLFGRSKGGDPQAQVYTKGVGQFRIHPSRVIEFTGNPLPDWRIDTLGGGWGDGVLQTVDIALKSFGTTLQSVGAMMSDAKVDIFKLPDFTVLANTEEYERKIVARFSAANRAKSSVNAILMDLLEEHSRISTNFASIPELVHTLMTVACGAGGIPLSRAVGSAPNKGLSGKGGSGGEVDVKNYYDTVASDQNNRYRPAMKYLDEVIIRSATGARDPNIHYDWNPLYQPDPSEVAAVALQKAQITQAYVTSGLFNEEVIREAASNQIVEDGVYPGWEAAVEAHGLEPPAPEPGDAGWSPTMDPTTGKPLALPKPSGGGDKGGGEGGGGQPINIHLHPGATAVTDYNPNHDPETGRFASAGSASGKTSGSSAHKAGLAIVQAALSGKTSEQRAAAGEGDPEAPTAEQAKPWHAKAYQLGRQVHAVFHSEGGAALVSKQVASWAVAHAKELPKVASEHSFEVVHTALTDAVSDHIFEIVKDSLEAATVAAGAAVFSLVGMPVIGAGVGYALSKAVVDHLVDVAAEKVGVTPESMREVSHRVVRTLADHSAELWRSGAPQGMMEVESAPLNFGSHSGWFEKMKHHDAAPQDDDGALPFLKRLAELLAEPLDVADFDPNEPRDPVGKWTMGGGGVSGHPFSQRKSAPKGVAFVSPNTDNLGFPGAVGGLTSERQSRLRQASDEIDRRLGLKSKDVDVVGAWKDGAENSVMTEYRGGDFEKQKLAAVMKGYLADQKSVLVFKEDKAGPHYLYSFDAKGSLPSIHKGLLEDGVAFHTIVPHVGGATVFVADLDGKAADAVEKGAKRYGSEVYFQRGAGEFVGTQLETGSDREQRDDARHAYARAIEGSGVQGGGALWQDIHNAYGEGLVRQEKPLVGNLGHPKTISTRPVLAKGKTGEEMAALAEQRGRYLRADVAAYGESEEGKRGLKQNIALFRSATNYPQFRPGELNGDDKHDLGVIKARLVDNIKFMWNSASEQEKTEWKNWYDGAKNLVMDQVKKHGIDQASATGVFASLSPQRNWDQNVYLGKAVISALATKQNQKWDAAMTATAARLWKPKDQPLLDSIRGKTLGELTSPVQKAMWIRTESEAHSDGHFPVIKTNGEEGDLMRKGDGTPSNIQWGALAQTTNAVKAYEANGDREQISEAMGTVHKVRSFYNNILDPGSPNGDVTIDTHAAGAALLVPYGGKSTQINQLFGTGQEVKDKKPGYEPSSNSDISGLHGLYPIYADAYREAAKDLGVLPRQLQSVVWERKISTAPPIGSAGEIRLHAVEAVWRDYHDGKISLKAAQKKALDTSANYKAKGGVEGGDDE